MSHNSSHCFFPSYCSVLSTNHCMSTPLSMCPPCSMTNAIGFLFAIVLLGILIIICNCFVIIPIIFMDASSRTRSDNIKASLAVADILPGFNLLALSAPKLIQSMDETPEEIMENELNSVGTIEAFFAGILFLFLYSSTIYHLFYMSIQRYIAINWPMRYRHQSLKSIRLQLSLIWLLSLLSGTSSGWFQDSFHFVYSAHTFQYLPDVEAGKNIHASILIILLFFVVPYLSMTLLTFITAAKLRKMKKFNKEMRKSVMQPSSRRGSKELKSMSQDLSAERRKQRSLDALNKQQDRTDLTQKLRNPSVYHTSSSLEFWGSRNSSASESQSGLLWKNLTLPNQQPVTRAQSNLTSEGRRNSLTIRYNNSNSGISTDIKEINGSIKKSKDSLNATRRGSIDALLATKPQRSGSCDFSLASNDVPTLTRIFGRLSSNSRMESQRKQFHYFVTIGIMQVGFSVTVVPLLISLSLFSFETESCSDGIFHFITYYISLWSSLVNVFVYSFRDKRFRRNVSALARRFIAKVRSQRATSG